MNLIAYTRKRNKVLMSALALSVTTAAFVQPISAQVTNQSTDSTLAHKLTGVPKIKGEAAFTKAFPDVPKNHTHYEGVATLASQGVISGYLDGTFGPNNAITRQQMAKMISGTFKLEKVRDYVAFPDVQESNSFYPNITELYEAGIVDGSQGSFNPTQFMTRAQMAKVIVLMLGVEPTPKGDNPFADTKGNWAEDYITVLHELGITTGTTKTTYSPYENVTRGQFATFMVRAVQLIESLESKEKDKPVEKISHTTVNTPMTEFNEVIKNDPVYNISEENLYAIEETYANERFRQLITEKGRAAVAATSMKYTSVGGDIVIEKEGYPNQVAVEAGNNNNIRIYVDFKNEEAVDLARQFMKIAYPEVDIDAIIEQRATEARLAYEKEKNLPVGQRTFQGNSDAQYQSGFKIKVGTDAFLEYFWIEVDNQ